MSYSGSGDVTARSRPSTSTSPVTAPRRVAARPADFAGFTPGNIALIQRGTCSFRVKVDNAAAAGASAVIVFNQGNVDPDDDRFGLFFGTLDPPVADIPALSTTFALGETLATTTGLEMRVAVDATIKSTTTFNVLADTPGGRADRTVSSVLTSIRWPRGRASTTTAAARLRSWRRRCRWPSSASSRPTGCASPSGAARRTASSARSTTCRSSTPGQLKEHAVNLNFDMVGSPNFVRFVYDGDGSAFGVTGPNGSARVEQVFLDYFASQGLATEPTEFDGRSDYFAFINNGIPAGGLFTGAEGIKTAAEAAIYGGTAGDAYDPCYHPACDTIDNLSNVALDQMSDAIAHATLTFAMTTSAINGTAKGGGGSTVDFDAEGQPRHQVTRPPQSRRRRESPAPAHDRRRG